MAFSIRLECTAEDRPFIERLNPRLTEVISAPTHSAEDVVSFQDAFTSTAWSERAGQSATFIAVEETGERIGYVNVREGLDDVLDEPCGYIALLAVERQHEGKGIAKALIAKAEEWANEKGFERIALDVFSSNTRALEFYEKSGYRPETLRVVKKLGITA